MSLCKMLLQGIILKGVKDKHILHKIITINQQRNIVLISIFAQYFQKSEMIP